MPDPDDIEIPTGGDIEPLPNDPLEGFIKLNKELGRNFKEMPLPLASVLGDMIQSGASMHEAIHLLFMNSLRFRNFVEQGGVDAVMKEIEAVQENPVRGMEVIQQDLEKMRDQLRRQVALESEMRQK